MQYAAGDDFISGIVLAIFSAYVSQIFAYSPGLVVPAMVVILISSLITLATALLSMKHTKRPRNYPPNRMVCSTPLSPASRKLACPWRGKRAFGRWANAYSGNCAAELRSACFSKVQQYPVHSCDLHWVDCDLLLCCCHRGRGCWLYGLYRVLWNGQRGFYSLFSIVSTIAGIKPTLEMALPF